MVLCRGTRREHRHTRISISPDSFIKSQRSYPGFSARGYALRQDNPLHKLDAAYSYTGDSVVPYPQDPLLDRHHSLPSDRVVGIVDPVVQRSAHTPIKPSTQGDTYVHRSASG